VSDAAIAAEVGVGKFVKTLLVTVVSAIVVAILSAPPDV
jgi:prolyl-tRNA editing enzyme YbaK/EbsC (Cys-tRNA(Pro) deacylase)